MFRLNKQVFIALLPFIGSLASMANISRFTTCRSLNNLPCMAGTTLIDLNPDEYNQGLRYYQFIVKLGRCNRSCNTVDDLSGRIYITNGTDGLNLNVSNMITKMNESKTLTKLISCES